MKVIFITKIKMDRVGWKLQDNVEKKYRYNNMSYISFNEGYLNALKDLGIITEDKYIELGIKYGVFKKVKEEEKDNDRSK